MISNSRLIYLRNTAFGLVLLGGSVQAKVLYDFSLSSAELKSRLKCSNDIGSGANLVVGQKVLKGKCQVASENPTATEVEVMAPMLQSEVIGGATSKFLSFETSSTSKLQFAGEKAKRDRSELALLEQRFNFDQTVHLRFQIRIPSSSVATENSYYLMQMWQCSGESPIAGIRLKRNTSHQLEFVTRSDIDQGSAKGSFLLPPDSWNDVHIAIRPSTAGNALFVVRVGGVEVARSLEDFGFVKTQDCVDDFGGQSYRLKFGIYKYHEGGKKFVVHYRDLKIADFYKDLY